MDKLDHHFYKKFCSYAAHEVLKKSVPDLPTSFEQMYEWCDKCIQTAKSYSLREDQHLLDYVLLCADHKDARPESMARQIRLILANIDVKTPNKIPTITKYLTT